MALDADRGSTGDWPGHLLMVWTIPCVVKAIARLTRAWDSSAVPRLLNNSIHPLHMTFSVSPQKHAYKQVGAVLDRDKVGKGERPA